MRHRAAVLGELGSAQQLDVFYPLDRGGTHGGRKSGVAKYGKALFQTELEPVATGDAVAAPVMEILVRDYGFDPLESGIRAGIGITEHAGGIEDIQALVFHRAHVEIIHRHDIEQLQVVFPAIDLLIPAHGFLE